MKTTVGAGVNLGPISAQHAAGKLGSAGQTKLLGSPEHAKLLQQSFRGQVSGHRTTATPDGVQILRSGKTGLFNLKSFVQLKQAPPQAVAAVLQPVVAAPVVALAAPPVGPMSDRLATAKSDAAAMQVSVQAWQGDEQASHLPKAGKEAGQKAVLARNDLGASIKSGLDGLSKLEAALPNAGLGPDELRAAKRDIQTAKKQYVDAALKLALPGLFRPGTPPLGADRAAALADSALALHSKMEGAGVPGYRLDKVLSSLSNVAAIRSFSEMPVQAKREQAAEGLNAMLGTMLDAVKPGRDGAALNGLLGMDGDMDTVVKALKVDAMSTLRLERVARDTGTPIAQLPAATKQEARDSSRKMADMEGDLIQAKQQLRRAIGQRAGAADLNLGGVAGMKVDASLVKGLRNGLGASAKEVGVVIGSLLAMERTLGASAEGTGLLRDVQSQLAAKRAELAAVPARAQGVPPTPEESELRSSVRYLERREQSLQSEESMLAPQLAAATAHRANLDAQLAALGQGADPGELQGRRVFAEHAVTSLQGRMDAASPPAALTQARTDLDHHTQRVGTLKSTIAQLDQQPPGAVRDGQLTAAKRDLDFHQGAQATARDQLMTAQQSHVAAQGPGALLGGLTPAELKALDLSDTDAREVMDTMVTLSRQGLAGAEQVGELLGMIHGVMNALDDASGAVPGQAALLANLPRNEDKARVFGELLIRNLTGDATVSGTYPTGTAPAARQAMDTRIAGTLHDRIQDLADPSGLQAARGQTHALLETRLLAMTGQLNTMDQQREDATQALRDFNAAAPGRSVDLAHPEGLRAAKLLQQALALYDATGNMQNATPAQQQTMTELRAQLSGYNENTLKTHWHSRTEFTLDSLARLAGDPISRRAIVAQVTLREQPAERAAQHGLIESTVADMDAEVQARITGMRGGFPLVRDMVRAAVLSDLASSGASVTSYRPAEHAAAIKDQLAAWGLPIADFQPEINAILSQSFGPDELNLWMAGTRLDGIEQQMQTALAAQAATIEASAERTGISADAKAALLNSLDTLPAGSKVKLTVGNRVEMQTGSIPVDPAGIMGVNVKLARGTMEGMEISRGGDGYELVLRDGWDGKVGVDLSAKLWKAEGVGLNASLTVGLEGSGYRTAGVALRFPNTPAGKDALKATLDNLLNKGSLGSRDLSRAAGIMPLVESKLAGKFGVTGKLGVAVPKTGELGLSAGLALSRAGVTYVAANTNMEIRKGEVETSIALTGTAGLRFSAGDVQLWKEDNKKFGVGLVDVQASGSTAWVYKTKSKEVRGGDGLVRSGEHVAQMVSPPAGKHGAIGRMGGEKFTALMTKYERDNPALAGAISELVSHAGNNDMISLVSALDERAMAAANDKLQQAKALRDGQVAAPSMQDAAAQATKLEAEAQALIDDPKNYTLAKIQLIPTQEHLTSLSATNLYFVKWNSYVEDKGEFVAAEIKLS